MPDPDYFEIKTRTGVDGTTEVELVVQEPGLDRELVTQYQFQLVAYDGGSPAKTDSMLLNITIGRFSFMVCSEQTKSYDMQYDIINII